MVTLLALISRLITWYSLSQLDAREVYGYIGLNMLSIFTKTLKLVIILWLMSWTVFSQENIKIVGRIVDKDTKEPLAYAHVGIMGKAIGTISNLNGEFEFNIPSQIRDSLFVSHIGYETLKLSIKVARTAGVFYLKVGTTLLGDLVVTPDKLTAKQIVEKAIENIPENYPVTPALMEGFYRDWHLSEMTDIEGKIASLTEAAVNIYDKGYGETKKASEKVYLLEVRHVHGGAWNTLQRLLIQNFVKYNHARGNYDMIRGVLDFPNNLHYEIEKLYVENEESLYVIKVSVPDNQSIYRLFIDQSNYAIVRIDLTGNSTSGLPLQMNKEFSTWRVVGVDNTLRFKQYEGKYFLGYIRSHWRTEMIDLETNKVARREEFYNELLINNLTTDETEVEEKRKKISGKVMRGGKPLDKQAGTYNEEFWDNYNIVKDNPIEKELLELLKENN